MKIQLTPLLIGEDELERGAGLPHLHPPEVPEWADPNWQSYVVRIDSDYAKARDHVASRLFDADIACRPGYMACHTEPVYGDAASPGSVPATEALLDSALILPLYPQMTDVEQDFVVDRLAAALAE